MITSVSINNLRGISAGTVKLNGLTVLVGPNGAGKSTILEAISIGVSPEPAAALGAAVLRRKTGLLTAGWLVKAGQAQAAVTVTLVGRTRRTTMEWNEPNRVLLKTREPAVPGGVSNANIEFRTANEFDSGVSIHPSLASIALPVRFIDMRFGASNATELTQLLTKAKADGTAKFAVELTREVVPWVSSIEILAVGSGHDLGLVSDSRAVPVSVSGDGVRALTRLALELAQAPSLVLIEEPEVHQHPRALRMSARAIIGALKRGRQIVIATHSLELIDDLLSIAADEGQLEKVSIQRLKLDDAGTLSTSETIGADAQKTRFELEAELR